MYEPAEHDGHIAAPLASGLKTFRSWFSVFQGTLAQADLDMQLFAQNPAQLLKLCKGAPCLQDVTDLHLFFTIRTRGTFSRWCPGFFRQLQILHLHFRGQSKHFAPAWDLSTCSALVSLTFSIDVHNAWHDWEMSAPEDLCLSAISRVTTRSLELRFQGDVDNSSLHLDCTSWSVCHASILCYELSHSGLPPCVTESMGALMVCASQPSVTVNGMAPEAAIALAAASSDAARIAATSAPHASSDSD